MAPLEKLSVAIADLAAPELAELRRLVDLRLTALGRSGGRSLAERLEAAATVELVALVVKRTGIRCRTLDTGERVTLRPQPGVRHEAEAQILTVAPRRAWAYGRTVYVSGTIQGRRIDAAALKLEPLKLTKTGTWDPARTQWSRPGKPLPDYLRPIIAAGPRPSFVMESVLPGFDPKDPGSDPIASAVELADDRGWGAAYEALAKRLEEDLRALDAHAHLGDWKLGEGGEDWRAREALPHFQAGAAIGELSLGPGFSGVLPGLQADNRAFLRCLHGLGRCLSALGHPDGAREVFLRLLWLDPDDAQGALSWLESGAGRLRGKENERHP